MSLTDLLAGELHAGLPRLRGAMVQGTVPLHQEVVRDVLPLLPGCPPGVDVASRFIYSLQAPLVCLLR